MQIYPHHRAGPTAAPRQGNAVPAAYAVNNKPASGRPAVRSAQESEPVQIHLTNQTPISHNSEQD